MTREQFHYFMRDPRTGPRLDAMLADNARVDRAQAPPHACCGEYGAVVHCEDGIDTWTCPYGHTWTTTCR